MAKANIETPENAPAKVAADDSVTAQTLANITGCSLAEAGHRVKRIEGVERLPALHAKGDRTAIDAVLSTEQAPPPVKRRESDRK